MLVPVMGEVSAIVQEKYLQAPVTTRWILRLKSLPPFWLRPKTAS